MKKIAFFGGTGGLGRETISQLVNKYDIDIVGSDKVNLNNIDDIKNYFTINNDIDILIIFSNYNFNSFIHKYTGDNVKNLQDQISINITGVVEVIAESLKIMRDKNYGRIIITSSVTVNEKVPGTGIYSSCKAFYENLVKNIAIENGSKNITSNCIQLGYMDGGLAHQLPEDFLKNKILSIPAKRLGSCQEIASTIELLINNEYINGSTIKITGGL